MLWEAWTCLLNAATGSGLIWLVRFCTYGTNECFLLSDVIRTLLSLWLESEETWRAGKNKTHWIGLCMPNMYCRIFFFFHIKNKLNAEFQVKQSLPLNKRAPWINVFPSMSWPWDALGVCNLCLQTFYRNPKVCHLSQPSLWLVDPSRCVV